jgi:hypothetical protein
LRNETANFGVFDQWFNGFHSPGFERLWSESSHSRVVLGRMSPMINIMSVFLRESGERRDGVARGQESGVRMYHTSNSAVDALVTVRSGRLNILKVSQRCPAVRDAGFQWVDAGDGLLAGDDPYKGKAPDSV